MRPAFNPRRDLGASSLPSASRIRSGSNPHHRPPLPPPIAEDNGPSSDRLRKLIEKNRAKQLARALEGEPKQSTVAQKLAQKAAERSPPSSSEKSPTKEVKITKSKETVTPALVFKDQNMRSKVLTPGSSISTLTKKVSKAVKKRKKRTMRDFLVLIAWPIYLFLVGRLAFSQGGILEYYQRQEELNSKEREIVSILQDNREIEREIDLIKNDKKYQRQIIRDHLGHIDADEYLILFNKEQKRPSI